MQAHAGAPATKAMPGITKMAMRMRANHVGMGKLPHANPNRNCNRNRPDQMPSTSIVHPCVIGHGHRHVGVSSQSLNRSGDGDGNGTHHRGGNLEVDAHDLAMLREAAEMAQTSEGKVAPHPLAGCVLCDSQTRTVMAKTFQYAQVSHWDADPLTKALLKPIASRAPKAARNKPSMRHSLCRGRKKNPIPNRNQRCQHLL